MKFIVSLMLSAVEEQSWQAVQQSVGESVGMAGAAVSASPVQFPSDVQQWAIATSM
jgi:hypothetical protein